MSDFSFSDDQELQRLNAQVLADPEEFDLWDKLVRAAEAQEGGVHRNSSPGAIASTRDVYDKLLARFPLFFGYWKKYADLEFAIAGTEAAEMVYERGVASIGSSVDLWANYCNFKVETSHDTDVIRELFERGAESVGLDFLAHPFWDKYLDYEERIESQDRIFAILSRIIHIPMHQYARYFERYSHMANSRSLQELAPPEMLASFQQGITQGGTLQKSDREMEQEMRHRVNQWSVEVFQRTQGETTKRWTYESGIKRPYYHVTELDEEQLVNWRKYLDFEEGEGDYTRTKFLYERCLVTAANYEEFWLRYARWMFAQPNKQEEVRNIYERASCTYVPISQPTVRLFYAQFEEAQDRPYAAISVYEAILDKMPENIEAVVALANVHRRQHGVQAAIEVVKQYITRAESDPRTSGALVSEWARLTWQVVGSADEARQIYQKSAQAHSTSHAFWASWLKFEMRQPTSEQQEPQHYARVKAVFNSIRNTATLPPESIKELASVYFDYLRERGGKDAMKEFMQLDREINGPASVALTGPAKVGNGIGIVMGGQQPAAPTNPTMMVNPYAKQVQYTAMSPVNEGQPYR